MIIADKRKAMTLNSWIASTPRIPAQLAQALFCVSNEPVKCRIPVFEDSMSPVLKLRTSMSIEQVMDLDNIESGAIYYIVDNNLKGFLRRVTAHEGSDYLRLSCDNPDKDRWHTHYMRTQAVRAIFKVVE